MKQEPTAWINKERDVITFDNLFPEMTPLYEKREWVDLTNKEVDTIRANALTKEWAILMAQSTLKEKNT